MRTSNLYRVCFILTILALLALGGVLLNGCKTPITNTNTAAIGNTGTYTNSDVRLPDLPLLRGFADTVMEMKKAAEEVHEAKASETLLIVIVIVICGVNILIYMQVRKTTEKIEKPRPTDSAETEAVVKPLESTVVKPPEQDEPSDEHERLVRVLASASDQLEAIKNELNPFSEAVETTTKAEEFKKAIDEQRKHLMVSKKQEELKRKRGPEKFIIKPKP